MPLQFPDPTIALKGIRPSGEKGIATELGERYREGKKQRELERAYNVLSGGEDVDTRNFLQKAGGGEHVPMDDEAAMDTIRKLNPEMWLKVEKHQRETEKREEDKAKIYEDKFSEFATDTLGMIEELKGMKEGGARTGLAKEFIESLKGKYGDMDFAKDMDAFDADGDGVLSDEELYKAANSLRAYQEKAEPQSPRGKLVDDLKQGVITQDQFDDAVKPTQSTGEFERLLKSSNKTDAEKDSLRETRLEKLASGGEFSMSLDSDGNLIITKGGAGELTKAQASKAKVEFKNKRIQSKKFIRLSNRIIESLDKESGKLGVVGFIARLSDEIKSIAKNISSELGVDVSDVSMDVEDYEFGGLASQSAEFKTNTLTLALIFAGASGLGQGRALTDKDLQRSIDAIGASTNSTKQLTARLKTIQQNLDDGLSIEAEEFDYEYESIIEIIINTGGKELINNPEANQIKTDYKNKLITKEQAKEKLKALEED